MKRKPKLGTGKRFKALSRSLAKKGRAQPGRVGRVDRPEEIRQNEVRRVGQEEKMTQSAEPPVGDQYGLKPRLDHTLHLLPPVTSRDLIADDPYEIGSEFGGVAGLIQPPPHVPTAGERLMMIHAIDPTDPGTEVGSIAAPELEGF